MAAAHPGWTTPAAESGRRGRIALLAAVLLLAGAGDPTGAAAAHKRPDYAGKDAFKAECEALGGTFREDGLGNTECHFADGTWIECDANGKDCWVTPPEVVRPGRPVVTPADENALPDDGRANRPPTATADAYRTREGRTLRRGPDRGLLVNDADPDGDRLRAELTAGPRSGNLTLRPDGSFAYTPKRGFRGTVRFTYEAHDGRGGTATTRVTIEVAA